MHDYVEWWKGQARQYERAYLESEKKRSHAVGWAGFAALVAFFAIAHIVQIYWG